MICIGTDKLIFKKDIVGIFDCTDDMPKEFMKAERENVTPPPFKAFVVTEEDGKPKLYFTSFSARTLRARLNKKNINF